MRLGFPRTVRIIRSEDFGELLHSDSPATIRLGRELASVSVILNSCVGRVRFGFTVGKHNAPRSVDRALVKRVMRDCCRNKLPQFRALAAQHGVGLEIGLRLRRPLGRVPEVTRWLQKCVLPSSVSTSWYSPAGSAGSAGSYRPAPITPLKHFSVSEQSGDCG